MHSTNSSIIAWNIKSRIGIKDFCTWTWKYFTMITCHAYFGSDKSIPLKFWIFTPDETLTAHELWLPVAQLWTALSEKHQLPDLCTRHPPPPPPPKKKKKKKREELIIFHQTKLLNAPKNFLLCRSDINQHKILGVSKLEAMPI